LQAERKEDNGAVVDEHVRDEVERALAEEEVLEANVLFRACEKHCCVLERGIAQLVMVRRGT
jgi:hypothetical protein